MIYFPKIYGTCGGANKAISLAYKLRHENKDKNIYIYKEILHNPYVINELEKNNIYCIEDLSILNSDDILVIRAHGEVKETYDYLNERGITYYDATCVNVSKVHDLVTENYNKGYKIIIVGKKSHPEVIATNSRCNNEAFVIEDESDYSSLSKEYNYYVVCQTTIGYDRVSSLLNYLKFNDYNYIFDNTICSHQKLIHSSSVDLAKNVDLMIIIGGKNSSNTKELYNECSKVCKSYHFSDLNECYELLKKENLSLKTKIGITGGASTPKEQINEFMHLIEFIVYYKNQLVLLQKEIIKYNKTLLVDENKFIFDAVNKFIDINKDGKFVRGCLIDLGYKLYKHDDYATSLAIAYETFQTSILIHDDIIDNANLRRGKDTISYSYKKEFENVKYKDQNISNNLALCIGDIGLFYASALIVKKYKNDKNLAKILDYYHNIVINTAKGEILDVYLPFKEKNNIGDSITEDDIFEIYRLKTSWYTIVGPFTLGMMLGNASKKEIINMTKILESLGIAFQIKDDILGIFSNSDVIGKSNSSDIEEFKQTILYSYVKLNNSKYYKDLLKYYGKSNLTQKDILEVQNIFIESGALEYANNKMNELFEYSKNEISSLKINEYTKNILLGFITYLEIREK